MLCVEIYFDWHRPRIWWRGPFRVISEVPEQYREALVIIQQIEEYERGVVAVICDDYTWALAE